ncbi:MAG: helix-turn-helix transcriptional regulator [Clostridiales bacterium]|nr:helix-turn-helix transcriptional regulator [Clostridiales bacterium]
MDKKFVQMRIARIRNAHNVSARKVSMELGQSTEYINQIENGKALPSLEGLFNICDYFNITLGEFFDDRLEFPVEYKHIIEELNKMDNVAINQIYELLKLINK